MLGMLGCAGGWRLGGLLGGGMLRVGLGWRLVGGAVGK